MGAGDIADIATGIIAFGALVVSCLAWKESRRSADAAADSAQAAARSVIAEEAALKLAAREAEQRGEDRRDAAGPQFRCVDARLDTHEGFWRADVTMRIDGGPEGMELRVELVPDTSFISLSYPETYEPRDSLSFERLVPGAVFDLKAQGHAAMPVLVDRPRVLLLRITAASQVDKSKWWVRPVPVDLQLMPDQRPAG
jgi:hypothetical protein